jgi:hypothetical protein
LIRYKHEGAKHLCDFVSLTKNKKGSRLIRRPEAPLEPLGLLVKGCVIYLVQQAKPSLKILELLKIKRQRSFNAAFLPFAFVEARVRGLYTESPFALYS